VPWHLHPTGFLYLQHGKPLGYGKNKDKGIRMRGTEMEVIS
jgi:hypothetical protein